MTALAPTRASASVPSPTTPTAPDAGAVRAAVDKLLFRQLGTATTQWKSYTDTHIIQGVEQLGPETGFAGIRDAVAFAQGWVREHDNTPGWTTDFRGFGIGIVEAAGVFVPLRTDKPLLTMNPPTSGYFTPKVDSLRAAVDSMGTIIPRA